MTLKELFETLAALPETRRTAGTERVEEGVVVAGIEIARTEQNGERSLRAAWRRRHGGGATPLLLVAPDTDGDADDDPRARVLGVSNADGPLRSMRIQDLAAILEELAGRPRLEATRQLAGELERLDQTGIPGIEVRQLLTPHTLAERLRGDPQRWQHLTNLLANVPADTTTWRSLLTGLGWSIQQLPRRGYLLRHDDRPAVVVHAVVDPAEFARLDDEGRPPEGVLLNDCTHHGANYGILASGSRLRLLATSAVEGAAAANYLDLDAAALQDDDRPYLGLLSPDYLAEGRFATLRREARDFGAELRRRLDERLRQSVLPRLGAALGARAQRDGQDLDDDTVRRELERAALTLVFRTLFVLYAEAAGYLPMDRPAYRSASLTALVEEAADRRRNLDPDSTFLWDRFATLVRVLRSGDRGRQVPAYNGALFAADGFEGAASLERMSLPDPAFAEVLVGIGHDPEEGRGTDYSTLAIGHLGHIYEGLLSLRLSVADEPLVYDATTDRYEPAGDPEAADVPAGTLLWQTHEGGRKAGGVYYTRSELVRHLVRQAVVPAFEAHLEEVEATAADDPAAAAEQLFDFAVIDPACGSAHFLVEVVSELADMVVSFLGRTPLPQVHKALARLRSGAASAAQVDDVALLARLVLKRCVYGVDVSPMGAEVAKLSLWLASFVPGLSLAYLDRNVVVGNSLIGVARPSALATGDGSLDLLSHALDEALKEAAEAAGRAARIEDRTPEEYRASEQADAQAEAATADLRRVLDLWTAEPFGVDGAREAVRLHGPELLEGTVPDDVQPMVDEAEEKRADNRFLHWPLTFPLVFDRDNPGFDAIVGNPPWEEVTVERLEFYARFRPGIRGLPDDPREDQISDLLEERPDLRQRLEGEQDRAEEQRDYFAAAEYPSMAGDPDLYKLFCQRYRHVLRDRALLGVVLPRSTFATKGSADFRDWLFREIKATRIDSLTNRRLWAFDTHPQYSVALLTARATAPSDDHAVLLAGPAESLEEWEEQLRGGGLAVQLDAFGPDWTVPLIDTQAQADLLAKLRRGTPFPYGGGRWRCFATRELDETNDKRLWQGADDGLALWKGESFDQYDPHGAGERPCPPTDDVWERIRKSRPGAGSMLSDETGIDHRRAANHAEVERARVAFRDVSRRNDSRTVRTCLVPPDVLLTNPAPYLTFVDGGDTARAACLGIMNSLPFDWQARRFVEVHLNFFILEGLNVPGLSDDDFEAIAVAAARLSCVDDRFADFAASVGVDWGPLPDDERARLRAEIDARVARAWQLTPDDLEVVFADFTTDAVPPHYRTLVRERLDQLRGET